MLFHHHRRAPAGVVAVRPRILHSFTRDRGNQVVLGTFIAGFTYCLLVLRAVNGTEDKRFVPHLSVSVGLLLALDGVAVLIYFIHHAASLIQAEHLIAAVSSDLGECLDRLFPSKFGGESQPPVEQPRADARPAVVTAADGGYLQAIGADSVMELAVRHDLFLRVEHRPGRFVIAGNPLAHADPAERVSDEIAAALRKAFFPGPRRTLFQDAEFGHRPFRRPHLRGGCE